MNNFSYFIKGKAMFGSFPSQDDVYMLETEFKTRVFVDVTQIGEQRTVPYKTAYRYISYPIHDNGIPYDPVSFAQFIVLLADIIDNIHTNETVYIHCKGGHGRSGLVVASLLCYVCNLHPESALEYTNNYHNDRLVMRDRWRRIGSPQTYAQKQFVRRFFSSTFFYINGKSMRTAGFSNHARTPVRTLLGNFPTAEAAVQALKNPDDKEYVEKQLSARSPVHSRILGYMTRLRPDWLEVCDELTLKVLRTKFDQHPEIRNRLMETGLRTLIYKNRDDLFWGDGYTGTGVNRLGKLLGELRTEYHQDNNLKNNMSS